MAVEAGHGVGRASRVAVGLVVVADTGSVERDLTLLLRHSRRLLRHRLVARILPDLHAEMPLNPQLAASVRATIQIARRDRGKLILRRAVERGELHAMLDLDLAADLLAAMIYWRMIVTRERADERDLAELVSFSLRGLGWSTPAPRTAP